MNIKISKNDKYQWTRHAVFKMRQYGLSSQRAIRVIKNPERTEVGIVENTVAVMQPAAVKWKNFKKIWNQEIWVMYQIKNKNANLKMKNDNVKLKNMHKTKYRMLNVAKPKLRIISVWRYPGVSPKNNPIPEEVLREIRKTT